ncbi:MAG: DUF1849 family protein [Rhodospirillaceae bacterium]|nr:DUF1849 family protein [Rhodospirillaceae bacterium]
MAMAGGPAWAASLPSYDASYSVQLARASLSTGPRAADGLLDYRFSETCDGWQTRTRVVMELAFRDGTTIANERDFESFESKDGRSYTFAVRTVKGGTPVEAFKGAAKMFARGGGSVVYELPSVEPAGKPRKVTVTLPKGTLLPVRHALALLDQAGKGEKVFRSIIFNGASSVGPRAASTVIGPQLAMAGDPGDMAAIDAGLLSAPSWNLNLAFYNLFERRDTPNFEVFQRFYATGISPAFEQEFDDFTIRAALDRLQRLDRPVCDAPVPEKGKR